jgi:hypothetical protein
MKHISVEMFPEFKFLGVLVGILMLVGLVTAISGRSRMLFAFTLLSYVYAVAALWDFWSWGYEYGHNLDPNAAIKVQDMSYQPPLIGYKNLLNFTAYSGPDIGAWVIIGVCLMATLLWWWEFLLAGTFVLVKGGTFTMGCQDGRDVECYENEKPPHTVTLSSFYMGQTEVTQAQWATTPQDSATAMPVRWSK